jgi:hypothetical protein
MLADHFLMALSMKSGYPMLPIPPLGSRPLTILVLTAYWFMGMRKRFRLRLTETLFFRWPIPQRGRETLKIPD